MIVTSLNCRRHSHSNRFRPSGYKQFPSRDVNTPDKTSNINYLIIMRDFTAEQKATARLERSIQGIPSQGSIHDVNIVVASQTQTTNIPPYPYPIKKWQTYFVSPYFFLSLSPPSFKPHPTQYHFTRSDVSSKRNRKNVSKLFGLLCDVLCYSLQYI